MRKYQFVCAFFNLLVYTLNRVGPTSVCLKLTHKLSLHLNIYLFYILNVVKNCVLGINSCLFVYLHIKCLLCVRVGSNILISARGCRLPGEASMKIVRQIEQRFGH